MDVDGRRAAVAVRRIRRSAEIRFADEADFRAVHSSAEYQAIREDGFNVSVAGHEVSIYRIDQQWPPAS